VITDKPNGLFENTHFSRGMCLKGKISLAAEAWAADMTGILHPERMEG